MKKICVFLSLLSSCYLYAQDPATRIISDIKKLSGEYLTDFKNIKGGIRSDDHYATVYFSRLKLTGSIDSTNFLYFIKEREAWVFSAVMNKDAISAGDLNAAVRSVSFSFGKLRNIATGVEWVSDYVPEIKKGVTIKLKDLFIRVFDAMGNPNDESGGRLTFTLGEDIGYRNK